MAGEAYEFSSCEEDPPEESSNDDCGDDKLQIVQRLGDSESDPEVSDQSSEENDAIPNVPPAAAPAAPATSKKSPVKGTRFC